MKRLSRQQWRREVREDFKSQSKREQGRTAWDILTHRRPRNNSRRRRLQRLVRRYPPKLPPWMR